MGDTLGDISEVSVASLIEALPDALIVVDVEGIIFLVNTQAEYLFGRPRSEILGTNIEDHLPERYRKLHVKHRAKYNSEPRVRPMGQGMAIFALQKNGTEVSVSVSLSPLMTPKGMFVLGVLRRYPGPTVT